MVDLEEAGQASCQKELVVQLVGEDQTDCQRRVRDEGCNWL
jgi:hypothetical protein